MGVKREVYRMKPFLIVYFSGVGNTKSIAEQIKNGMVEVTAELYSVEKLQFVNKIPNAKTTVA